MPGTLAHSGSAVSGGVNAYGGRAVGRMGHHGPMWRAMTHVAAWTAATGVAVTLSWFGVHHVLAATAYDDPPRALPVSRTVPVPSPSASGPTATPSLPTATATVTASASAEPSATSPEQPPGTSSAPATAAYGGTGNVHSYTVAGGRVVLDLTSTAATLVSANPDAGWSMKVWNEDQWIRVDFTSGVHASSVFCTWNGHAPTVTAYGA